MITKKLMHLSLLFVSNNSETRFTLDWYVYVCVCVTD